MSTERSVRGTAIRTFLIADIRGYTRFTAEHGDEAASRLTGLFAQVCGEGIEAWGGELVELRGDEALAVFESPRQALRCAVELQSAFADETRADPELPLPVGIGLDAGEAVPVGDGYRGAALNVAARLCAVAGAGEVLGSESLIHLAGQVDGLDYQPTEPAPVKGYDAPMAAVKILLRGDGAAGALSAAADISGPVPPLPPELDPIVPISGREAELRWLLWHWRRASHGHGRTVVISGPPGIGKTRLAAELATIAHNAGAAVVYVPGARLGDLPAPDSADRPVLTVVDDLDAAPADTVSAIVEEASRIAGGPTMFLVTHRREAPPQLVAIAERLATAEQRRKLAPLDAAAVRAIVALYAGRATDEAPVGDLLRESGGIPAAIHRVASQWARTTAAVRLSTSADRTAAGRRGLRDAEAVLIGDVGDLELARERDRLYAVDGVDETGASAASRTICPYKGLAEFEAADADYYFGRERLIAELIARFVGGGFLGLVGDSGSGKSSALRAGLLPALAGGVLPGSDSWPQALMRPGEHPLTELVRALVRAVPQVTLPTGDASAALDAALATLAPGRRLVVVVDQFEEAFNATRDEAERTAFVDLLASERPGLKVIVAIRADHYGRCAAYPALARLLGSDQVLVGPLTTTELAAVIEHPAQHVGLRVEPALTEALVADAGSEPGVLPLLSTCLLELWGARDGGWLTLAGYRAGGGMQGAIARLAEATYADLDPHRQNVARALLLRLAGPGEGAELVRRRVSLEELDADNDPILGEVLSTLTEARLLTAGEGHVEVAHEALLREWPRLQGWLAEDAAGRAVRLHLIGAVRDWQAHGRETGDLYRGARLAAALEWASEHQVELNASERAFLDESRHASEREVERQRRMNRRLRMLLAGAALLLLVAVVAGGFAVLQSVQAQQSALNARSRELTASALAAIDSDPSLAKLLAVQALNVADAPTYQTTSVLHRVLAADAVIARYSWPNGDLPELWADLDPTGRLLVASGAGGHPTTRLDVAEVGGSGGWVEFDRTGATVLQTARDGTLRRWDAHNGEVLASWRAVGAGRISVAADGRTVLVTDTAAPTANLLDVDARGDLGQIETCRNFTLGGSLKVHAGLATFGEICPDGTVALETGDLNSRTLLAPMHGWWPQDLAISPDGNYFVSQAADNSAGVLGPLKVADLRSGSPLVELQGMCRWDANSQIPADQQPGTGCVPYPQTPFAFMITSGGIRWSPDGTMIAAVDGTSGALVVWDARDGRIVFQGPTYPDKGVGQVAFAPDSKRLVMSYAPGFAEKGTGLVDMLSTETWATVATTNLDESYFGVDGLGFVGFSADGGTILAVGGFGGNGGATLLWLDAARLNITKAVTDAHTGSPKSMALSPDGSLLATGASDSIVRVWDAKTGELRQQLEFGGPEIQGVGFIDDRHLVVAPRLGDLLIMTVDPAELLQTVRSSVTRGFTATECVTYGINPCPTLAEMRSP